ncbi:hypothetical protein DKB98_00985 [Enterococcus faecalis]|uniref:hypothetical protein n=1 Tax=Enterococcus TaxID=1350 RepID=UPI0003309DDB|nr:hypothetical protein [Enterococcus faecalis]EGO2724571.1 hypothetical protein [Enterococcus faecalis]EGO5970815.1 hypothetical protein [Enterococcus faecalis]EHU9671656.1 hypothetical protein [Enterococcus faecalis]EHV0132420.1 hypothetical protein [Enterococcus faecalis]EHV0135251.1 hypothetical protein [Enterococcus faecalis]
MVSAKLVAEKFYNIPYLFHLKDPQLEIDTSGKTPDFFWLSNGTMPFLFETKGTAGEKISKHTAKKAKKQLAAISQIEIETDGPTLMYKTKDIKRHIISSNFVNNTLLYNDIDPEHNGQEKIRLDLNRSILSCYRHIMWLLNNTNGGYSFGNIKFLVYRSEGYSFGLDKELYDIFLEYQSKTNSIHSKKYDNTSFSGLYKKYYKRVSKFERFYISIDETISIR